MKTFLHPIAAAFASALLLVTLLGSLSAQDESAAAFDTPTEEKIASASSLPQPFDPTELNSLIENPPFTRSINPSDSLVLSGLAFIDGKPVATLFDSETKASIIVSDEPNAKGWTLNEALGTGDLSRAQAKVSIGGEVVSIRYNKDALTPDKLKKQRSGDSRGPSSGGPSGGDGYQRSGPRPSQEDMDRYKNLSDKSREKLRDEFTKNREKLMNATPEERAAFMRSTFERVAGEDQGGGGGGSSSSSGGGRGPGGGGPSGPGGGGPRGDGRGPGR